MFLSLKALVLNTKHFTSQDLRWSHPEDKTTPQGKAGVVYNIGNDLDERLNEQQKQTSAVCEHQTKTSHSISWEGFRGQAAIKEDVHIIRQKPVSLDYLV